MPPKSKGSKPAKPVDPYAHLSQAERRKLSTQLRKTVTRTTRRTSGTDDTLPDVAELVSARSKQGVHFADKAGGEHTMEMDIEGEGNGVGENEEEGGGEEEEEGVGAGEDVEDETEGGDGSTTHPVKTTRKAAGKARKGRVAGSKGFFINEEWIIADGVEEVLPRGEIGWQKVGKYFNDRVPKDRQRHWEVIRNKHGRMLKQKKPTGDGAGSKLHDKLLLVENARLEKEQTVAIDDEVWSDSDDTTAAPRLTETINAHAKLNPTPAPAPFGRSKAVSSKSTTAVEELDVIVLSSTDNETPAPPPQTALTKRKTKSNVKAKPAIKTKPGVKTEPGVKSEPGVGYIAEKVPAVAEVKSPTKRRENSRALLTSIQSTLNNETNAVDSDSAGVAKVHIFGRDRTIERLEKDLTETREKCRQLERQADNVLMVMTMYGIPTPEETGGPALGRALAGFLQTRFPASVSPATVLGSTSTAAHNAAPSVTSVATSIVSPVVFPSASPAAASTPAPPMSPTLVPGGHENCQMPQDIPIDPALYERFDSVPSAPVPSGSNLSAAEKGKLPVYLGY
ncbi:hypothetical protein RSOLAG22IIIB_09603 [Rhizoctonia solani]|uniref:Uncharacterized protein n=1 Tax=Rhizoctonia solani TaxID=456999 RepID=A0A0K6FZC6_9AGAM|nr:hypothetical protein RSOLAG22IIIB_09603 [Rhizoctonia solani]